MPIKDTQQRRDYFRNYMAKRRTQGCVKTQGLIDGDGVKPVVPPQLNRSLPLREIPRPFPYSSLVEQDGKLFDPVTGSYVEDTE